MSAISRRAFLGRSSALAVASLLPIPKAMALVAPNTPALRWFAVGDEEYVYPYLASSMDAAIRSHAIEHGVTVGEQCPECGEPNCTEHNADLDAPQPHLEEFSFEFAGDIPPEREPTKIEWMENGVNVCCDGCDYGEPDECYPFQAQALCCECLEVAKANWLDDLIGNTMKPAGRETG